MIRSRPTLRVGSLTIIGLCLALHGVPPADAQKHREEQIKRTELRELHSRIEALRREIADAEKTRADIADQLREAERAISDTGRSLRQLSHQKEEAQLELKQLNFQARQIEGRIATQQAQLEKLLYRHYVAGQSDALRQLLGGDDPNQIARNLYYLQVLSRGKAEAIETLRTTLREKTRLAESVQAKSAQLAEIEGKSRSEHAQLLDQREKRRVVLAGIADKIGARKREVDNLQRDEKRLTRLIEGLARIVQRPPPQQPAERPGQAEAAGPERPAPPLARSDQRPEDTPTGIPFSRLRGQLRLPARGELTNRFGAPRLEGGATWKGLFIRASSGDEVRAVAPGNVVFAEWLRGFGNLIIVDHGGGYLSVYGNNESLFKGVGETVRAGEAIASIGNSGGNPETGLYFEIRYQGQAIDPLKWVNLR